MHVQSYEDTILCHVFSLTLKGLAQQWFSGLPLGIVDDFDTLSTQFIGHFISNRHIKCSSSYLFSIKQNPKESLCNYIARFNWEAVTVSHATDEAKLMALTTELQLSDFLKYLMRKALTNFADAMTKAQKHMGCEDMFAARLHSTPPELDRDKKDRDMDRSCYRDQRR
ncbi:hypothetical protein CJ030_MR2G016680 [Morella rubra]|uniref:Retrotransposon gag domain-containing protein n=1 Tax=Morella rubra TaxID=262757 RepID=A0A6A1WES6_9ROSI|nr:hypothetical protein CJ030_MR2G016680 [Morella rubra]